MAIEKWDSGELDVTNAVQVVNHDLSLFDNIMIFARGSVAVSAGIAPEKTPGAASVIADALFTVTPSTTGWKGVPVTSFPCPFLWVYAASATKVRVVATR